MVLSCERPAYLPKQLTDAALEALGTEKSSLIVPGRRHRAGLPEEGTVELTRGEGRRALGAPGKAGHLGETQGCPQHTFTRHLLCARHGTEQRCGASAGRW